MEKVHKAQSSGGQRKAEFVDTVQRAFQLTPRIWVLYFLLPVVNSALVELPKNTVAFSNNSRVEFKCKSDQNIRLRWLMQPNTTFTKQLLFNGYGMAEQASSYCKIESEKPGKYSLNLTSVDEAAQTYFCQEPGSFQEVSADLIVIKEKLHCEKETENVTNMKCTVEFRGNWAPVLEWNLGEVITDGVNTVVIPNEMVISTLTVPDKMTSETYTCTTRFDISGKPQQTTSTNVPDYRTSCGVVVEAKPKVYKTGFSSESDESKTQMINFAVPLIFVGILILVAIMIIFCRIRRKNKQPMR